MWPGVRGTVNRNWAPNPGRPHALSHPPWSWASSRDIERPSPLPPTVRVLEGSALQNRVNTWCAWAALKPTPLSLTAIAMACLSHLTCTLTGRPSPCSIALLIRFATIL